MRPAVSLCLLLLVPATAVAHGVATTTATGPAVTVTATYGDGLPLSFEACEVLAPEDEVPFQVGRTDRLGRVVFAPDRPGTWQVKVTTADGHGTTVSVAVGDDLLTTPSGPTGARTRSWKIITGIGVLFGAFGLLALVQQRRT
jgi:nickel transport protein